LTINVFLHFVIPSTFDALAGNGSPALFGAQVETSINFLLFEGKNCFVLHLAILLEQGLFFLFSGSRLSLVFSKSFRQPDISHMVGCWKRRGFP